MHLACLDMEGVLTPELWVNVADRTAIEEFRLTTRQVPDYDELMRHRLKVMAEHHITLTDIQEVIAGIKVLDGARDFVDWLRERYQVIILSDTFYQFADSFMEQLGRPTLFCHNLVIDENDMIVDYKLRQQDQKRKAVTALQGLNFKVIAMGDSYNDTTMLGKAEQGVLFNPPANVLEEFPQFPVVYNYDDARAQFEAALERFDRETANN